MPGSAAVSFIGGASGLNATFTVTTGNPVTMAGTGPASAIFNFYGWCPYVNAGTSIYVPSPSNPNPGSLFSGNPPGLGGLQIGGFWQASASNPAGTTVSYIHIGFVGNVTLPTIVSVSIGGTGVAFNSQQNVAYDATNNMTLARLTMTTPANSLFTTASTNYQIVLT